MVSETKESVTRVYKKSFNKALGGGLAGASAMFIQVITLMPMRTTMNYQYRFGGSATETIKLLYKEAGLHRFYRGIAPALIQAPLCRFGDTAANVGALSVLESFESTKDLPIPVKTLVASLASASFRILLTPIDTVKTMLQTNGSSGIKKLVERLKVNGLATLWYGAAASVSATFIGHYPWFVTYNYLQVKLPQFGPDIQHQLARNAFIGLNASIASDCISNSARVLKIYRQTYSEKISYKQSMQNVIAKDGIIGLFGRGLKTRILANGIQGVMFSVLWKFFHDRISIDKN